MAPPWGIVWRKCATRGPAAAPPQSCQCFQRHSRTEPKQIDSWMPFWLHFGYIQPQCLLHFGTSFRFTSWKHFRNVFSSRDRTFNFSALANTQWIFRVFAMSQKISKQLQQVSKMNSQIKPKSRKNHKKSMKNYIRCWNGFYIRNVTKTTPKWKGKIENFGFGPLGRPRARTRTPKGAHMNHRAPKIEPKAAPELPK